MNIKTYLSERGASRRLAGVLRLSQAIVSEWKTGRKKVPAERCPAIERATGGAVTCEELRPDVDWAYLRATRCDSRKSEENRRHPPCGGRREEDVQEVI